MDELQADLEACRAKMREERARRRKAKEDESDGASHAGPTDGDGFQLLSQSDEDLEDGQSPAVNTTGVSPADLASEDHEGNLLGTSCCSNASWVAGRCVARYPRTSLVLSALLPLALSIWGLTLPITIDTGLDAFKIQVTRTWGGWGWRSCVLRGLFLSLGRIGLCPRAVCCEGRPCQKARVWTSLPSPLSLHNHHVDLAG